MAIGKHVEWQSRTQFEKDYTDRPRLPQVTVGHPHDAFASKLSKGMFHRCGAWPLRDYKPEPPQPCRRRDVLDAMLRLENYQLRAVKLVPGAEEKKFKVAPHVFITTLVPPTRMSYWASLAQTLFGDWNLYPWVAAYHLRWLQWVIKQENHPLHETYKGFAERLAPSGKIDIETIKSMFDVDKHPDPGPEIYRVSAELFSIQLVVLTSLHDVGPVYYNGGADATGKLETHASVDTVYGHAGRYPHYVYKYNGHYDPVVRDIYVERSVRNKWYCDDTGKRGRAYYENVTDPEMDFGFPVSIDRRDNTQMYAKYCLPWNGWRILSEGVPSAEKEEEDSDNTDTVAQFEKIVQPFIDSYYRRVHKTACYEPPPDEGFPSDSDSDEWLLSKAAAPKNWITEEVSNDKGNNTAFTKTQFWFRCCSANAKVRDKAFFERLGAGLSSADAKFIGRLLPEFEKALIHPYTPVKNTEFIKYTHWLLRKIKQIIDAADANDLTAGRPKVMAAKSIRLYVNNRLRRLGELTEEELERLGEARRQALEIKYDNGRKKPQSVETQEGYTALMCLAQYYYKIYHGSIEARQFITPTPLLVSQITQRQTALTRWMPIILANAIAAYDSKRGGSEDPSDKLNLSKPIKFSPLSLDWPAGAPHLS